MTNIERDRYLANHVLPLVGEINGWELVYGPHCGSWEWSHPGCEDGVYASPFWDGVDGVPVERLDIYGHGPNLGLYPFVVTGDPQTDAETYREIVRSHLPLIVR